MLTRPTVSLLALFTAAAFAFADDSPTTRPSAPAPPSGYHVAATFKIGGDGGWDYITFDPDGNRLFVSRADRVMVIDAKTGATLGTIAQVTGSHGIALAPDAGRGVATAGRSNDCVIFDSKSLATIGRVKTGDRPDGICYDPASKHVFACNGGSNSATVIDPTADPAAAALANIDLGGKPETPVADGQGHLFVNLEDKSEIAVIDTKTNAVTDHWSLGDNSGPTGLAYDPNTKCLYCGCAESKTLVAVDTSNGKVLAAYPTGAGVDAAAFDPADNVAFAPAADGSLTVVPVMTKTAPLARTLMTHRGARTIAIDTRDHRLFLPAADYGPQQQGQRRPRPLPGTFMIVVVEKD